MQGSQNRSVLGMQIGDYAQKDIHITGQFLDVDGGKRVHAELTNRPADRLTENAAKLLRINHATRDACTVDRRRARDRSMPSRNAISSPIDRPPRANSSGRGKRPRSSRL